MSRCCAIVNSIELFVKLFRLSYQFSAVKFKPLVKPRTKSGKGVRSEPYDSTGGSLLFVFIFTLFPSPASM